MDVVTNAFTFAPAIGPAASVTAPDTAYGPVGKLGPPMTTGGAVGAPGVLGREVPPLPHPASNSVMDVPSASCVVIREAIEATQPSVFSAISHRIDAVRQLMWMLAAILDRRPTGTDLVDFWSTVAFASASAVKKRFGVRPRMQDRLAAASELADRLHERPTQVADVDNERLAVPSLLAAGGRARRDEVGTTEEMSRRSPQKERSSS